MREPWRQLGSPSDSRAECFAMYFTVPGGGRSQVPKTWNSQSEYPYCVARWVPYIRT